MRLWNRTIEQMGDEARDVIEAQPEQTNAMGVVLNAWDDLSTCRPIGMSEGWIPWTACRDWGMEHELDVDTRRILWRVIHRLDIAELERRAFEAKSPR